MFDYCQIVDVKNVGTAVVTERGMRKLGSY